MDTRRLQIVGNRSFATSLPKQWVTDNKLKNHDLLYVSITPGNDLLVSAQQAKSDSKEVRYDVSNSNIISQMIVFCYTRNVEKIILYAKHISPAAVKEIHGILSYLEGYEIIDESPTEVRISFLFSDVEATLQHVNHRVIYLLKLQLDALLSGDRAGNANYEQTIDRLYYLSTRILFSCMTDAAKRAKNGINSIEDIFYWNRIVKRLESISDSLRKLEHLSGKDIEATRSALKSLDHLLFTGKDPHEFKRLHDALPRPKDQHALRIFEHVHDIMDTRISQFLTNIL